MPKPTYTVELDYSQLTHATIVLAKRLEHIDARFANNPNTPNARHLEDERQALRETIALMQARADEHFAKVRASVLGLDRAESEDVCGKFDGVCVRPRGHKGGCSNPAPEDSANIPCRCGVDVRSCRKGCRLWACCGGYVSEGHMTDCPGASSVIVEGAR